MTVKGEDSTFIPTCPLASSRHVGDGTKRKKYNLESKQDFFLLKYFAVVRKDED